MRPLPGQHASADADEMLANPCEGFNNQPCGKPSVHKICGEADSFGEEFYFQCAECRAKERQWYLDNPQLHNCEWCKATNVQTRPRRDFEEGMSGRVYDVCIPCIEKDAQRIRDEFEEDDNGRY